MIVAIDPGHAGEGNACALFDDGGRLVRVWFERIHATRVWSTSMPRGVHVHVVVERPEYQGARTSGARPIDLMNLAWSGALLAGAVVGLGATLHERTPTQWKGAEPKPRCHARLWEALDVEERRVLGGERTAAAIEAALEKGALRRWQIAGAACYGAKFTAHNLLDAAAIGCTFLGRMRKITP